MQCPPSKSRRSRIHPCTVRQATRPNGATIGALGATAANKGGTEELLQLATEHEATLNHIHVAHLRNKLSKQRGVGQPRHRAAVERLLLRTRSLVGSANARGLANVVHGAAKSAVRGPEATVGLVARPRSSTVRRRGGAPVPGTPRATLSSRCCTPPHPARATRVLALTTADSPENTRSVARGHWAATCGCPQWGTRAAGPHCTRQ